MKIAEYLKQRFGQQALVKRQDVSEAMVDAYNQALLDVKKEIPQCAIKCDLDHCSCNRIKNAIESLKKQ